MTAASPTPAPGNRRIQVLALLIFAALIVTVAVVVISGGSDGKRGTKGTQGVAQTRALLQGLTQDGATLGSADAPVTILEFVDLQCPFCAEHQLDQQPTVIKELVRTGKARLRVEPLAFLGPDSVVGQTVFLRLAAKNHAWDFLNLAYFNQGSENSGYMTDAWLRSTTASIPGVAPSDLARQPEPAITAQAEEIETLAKQIMKPGDGTPFFAVGASSAAPKTYKKVDLDGGGSTADAIAQAVAAVR